MVGLRTLWTEDFFKGRRNFIAYRTVRISVPRLFLFLSAKQQEQTDCRDLLLTGSIWTNVRHFYFRSRVEIRREIVSGFGRRNSRKPVTIGRCSIREETRSSSVESGTVSSRGAATTNASGRGIYFLEPVGQHRLHYYGCAVGDGSAPRFRKNPTKNQKTTGTRRVRGEKIRDERKISGERRERRDRGREEEREREVWADENGGTRREIGRERKRDSRGREFGVMKEKEGEKKEQQIDRCQREAERDGESSLPKKSSILLRPDPSLRAPSIFIPFAPTAERTFSLVPFVVHLEARQMSGIRLRHLSVSPFVTFDSRQIDEREKGTKTDFLSWPRRR